MNDKKRFYYAFKYSSGKNCTDSQGIAGELHAFTTKKERDNFADYRALDKHVIDKVTLRKARQLLHSLSLEDFKSEVSCACQK